jgi:hypothetical protein
MKEDNLFRSRRLRSYQQILYDLSEGQYRVTLHARKRMAERNVTHSDILSCGKSGKVEVQNNGQFRIHGRDCDGEKLTLICVEDDGVLIITIF